MSDEFRKALCVVVDTIDLRRSQAERFSLEAAAQNQFRAE
jgi:hypothetical protein